MSLPLITYSGTHVLNWKHVLFHIFRFAEFVKMMAPLQWQMIWVDHGYKWTMHFFLPVLHLNMYLSDCDLMCPMNMRTTELHGKDRDHSEWFDTFGSKTKWPPIYRRHFQKHFYERKRLISKCNFTEICSLWFYRQLISTGSDLGLAPSRRQAMIWTNDGLGSWLKNICVTWVEQGAVSCEGWNK